MTPQIKNIRPMREALLKKHLHLRAQRQQPFIIERLTWDYKLTGEEVAAFGSIEALQEYVNKEKLT